MPKKKAVPEAGRLRPFTVHEITGVRVSKIVTLEMAGRGCISGRVSEWPQLVPACRWAVDTIKKLKKELRQHEARFQLGWSRTKEADELWQKAMGKPNVWPDTGELVAWLMHKAGFKVRYTGLGKANTKLHRNLHRMYRRLNKEDA